MDASHERERQEFQSNLDSVSEGDSLQLLPREFPGPAVVKRGITLDGRGATLWAIQGPVLSIQADGVTLRNLKIEVTGDTAGLPEEECALLVQPQYSVRLENVEVRGSVMGLQQEEGTWRYPRLLHLGHIAHGMKHECVMRIIVPVPCQIISNITGLDFKPSSLNAGINEIHLTIDKMSQDMLLNGTVTLASAFLKRRIVVSAHVVSSVEEGQPLPFQGTGQVIWQPEDSPLAFRESQPMESVSQSAPPPPPQSVTMEPTAPPAPQPSAPPPVTPAAPKPIQRLSEQPKSVPQSSASKPRIVRTDPTGLGGGAFGGESSPKPPAAPEKPKESTPKSDPALSPLFMEQKPATPAPPSAPPPENKSAPPAPPALTPESRPTSVPVKRSPSQMPSSLFGQPKPEPQPPVEAVPLEAAPAKPEGESAPPVESSQTKEEAKQESPVSQPVQPRKTVRSSDFSAFLGGDKPKDDDKKK